MGKKRRRRSKHWDPAKEVFAAYRDLPSGYIVPPDNPPGYGSVTEQLRFDSPLVAGTVLFDDPFYNVLPPPPLLQADPCYDRWFTVMQAVTRRIEACPAGAQTPECDAAREAYFELAREYSFCMDRVYGLQRFQPTDEKKQKRDRKKRT